MASKLTTLSAEKSASELQMLSKQSIQWLMNKITTLRNMSSVSTAISKEKFRQQTQFKLGRLYFFFYDPKWKTDLPYYDIFPLVIPLERKQDGFLGLNFHYLPPLYRAAFMDKLMQFAITNEDNEPKRVRVTYDILSTTRSLREFRPCIKHYLNNHVKSKILTIHPTEWETALFLPTAVFVGAPLSKVYRESVQKANARIY